MRPFPRLVRDVADDLFDTQPRLSVALVIGRLIPPYVGVRIRTWVLRFAGVVIGERSIVAGRVWIGGSPTAARMLRIGADCFINDGCRFDVAAAVTIGDGVSIGHDVMVLTASHDVGSPTQRAGPLNSQPVLIEDGAWLGSRSVVMPGVTIGRGAVVGAGAIVAESVQSDTVVAGVPARPVRSLE